MIAQKKTAANAKIRMIFKRQYVVLKLLYVS